MGTSRLAWRREQRWDLPAPGSDPPELKLLMLGTAGTGKTTTAQTGIWTVRRILESFSAVVTVAHTGVAAVNLGGGAATIDSVFQLGKDHAEEDLEGEDLDRFVAKMQNCELLVVEEISTVGAAQFEMMSRRLEQVGKALWRRRVGTRPPETLGGFGGICT